MRRYACSASTGAVSVPPINCDSTKTWDGLLESHRATWRWFLVAWPTPGPYGPRRARARGGRKCNDTLGTRMRRCERPARGRLQLLDAKLELHPKQPDQRRECLADD